MRGLHFIVDDLGDPDWLTREEVMLEFEIADRLAVERLLDLIDEGIPGRVRSPVAASGVRDG